MYASFRISNCVLGKETQDRCTSEFKILEIILKQSPIDNPEMQNDDRNGLFSYGLNTWCQIIDDFHVNSTC